MGLLLRSGQEPRETEQWELLPGSFHRTFWLGHTPEPPIEPSLPPSFFLSSVLLCSCLPLHLFLLCCRTLCDFMLSHFMLLILPVRTFPSYSSVFTECGWTPLTLPLYLTPRHFLHWVVWKVDSLFSFYFSLLLGLGKMWLTLWKVFTRGPSMLCSVFYFVKCPVWEWTRASWGGSWSHVLRLLIALPPPPEGPDWLESHETFISGREKEPWVSPLSSMPPRSHFCSVPIKRQKMQRSAPSSLSPDLE